MNRLTLESFLSRARALHGDFYDYSEVALLDSKAKIRIRCPLHGLFEQIPASHVKGFGCRACAVDTRAEKRRLTIEQFVARSRAAHGAKYDYSKVIYRRNDENVEILCSVHGAFLQTPSAHMSGKGCMACAAAKRGRAYRIDAAAAFVERARAVHGDRYDYSAAVYTNSATNVDILCPEHGMFPQTPSNHLRGQGCRRCGRETLSGLLRKDTGVYLSEIMDVHGDRFDYSLANYQGAFAALTLICGEHGPITKPAREWLKYGCFRCGVAARSDKRRLSTVDFIELARKKHGNRYSYHHSTYTGMAQKLAIECSAHGIFRQAAATHIQGSGCRQCAIDDLAGERRISQEEFIERCVAIHDGLYDYSQTVYRGKAAQIEILCPVHGVFSQLASNHSRGSGCRRCAGYGRTTDEFIEEARAVHGDRYDYSLAEFSTVDELIAITCLTHGPFQQRALGHLHGKGCEGCQRDAWRLTQNEFLERSLAVHGSKYDYSSATYGQTNREKVTIVCPTHGPFEQMPVAHMEGHGCRQCCDENRRMSLEEFLQAARTRHGGRYDYTKVDYRGVNETVEIACPVHGEFLQAASTHLRGSGCPRCNLSGQYSIKAAVRGDYSFPGGAGMRTLYVALQLREGEPTFLNVGLAKQGYTRRYGANHPYSTQGDPDRLVLSTELAVLLEQVILKATNRFHYEPAAKFAGGQRECRTLEALPVIDEMIEHFAVDPARLAEAPWVELEARRHGMLHLLENFRSRIATLAVAPNP